MTKFCPVDEDRFAGLIEPEERKPQVVPVDEERFRLIEPVEEHQHDTTAPVEQADRVVEEPADTAVGGLTPYNRSVIKQVANRWGFTAEEIEQAVLELQKIKAIAPPDEEPPWNEFKTDKNTYEIAYNQSNPGTIIEYSQKDIITGQAGILERARKLLLDGLAAEADADIYGEGATDSDGFDSRTDAIANRILERLPGVRVLAHVTEYVVDIGTSEPCVEFFIFDAPIPDKMRCTSSWEDYKEWLKTHAGALDANAAAIQQACDDVEDIVSQCVIDIVGNDSRLRWYATAWGRVDSKVVLENNFKDSINNHEFAYRKYGF